jgi:hypothetical protein
MFNFVCSDFIAWCVICVIWYRRKSNEDLWICSRGLWPLDHRGGHLTHYFSATHVTPLTPKLYSRGWAHPVPDPLLLRNPGSAGNRTRISGSVARNSDHRGGRLLPVCTPHHKLFTSIDVTAEANPSIHSFLESHLVRGLWSQEAYSLACLTVYQAVPWCIILLLSKSISLCQHMN